MKTPKTISRKTGLVMLSFTFTVLFSFCSGKSNSEDDSFRQSIIDNPTKAVDENEHAKLNQKKPTDSTSVDSLNNN